MGFMEKDAFIWTSEKGGTYIAKAKAVSKNGVEQGKDASIIIQVSE